MTISHTTRLFGVLTHPGGRNIIHAMLAKAAEIADSDGVFLLFDAQPKAIADPVEALRQLHAGGLYLTGRHREAAAGVVDYLSDEAHGSGIINTVVFGDDTATGHNTEAKALIGILEEHKEKFARRSAVVLGGGATAKAAAYALVRHFRVQHVAIADRTPQQAQLLKQAMTGMKTDVKVEAYELFPPDIADILAEARLIVNATTVGTGSTEGETPITLPDVFHASQIVLDVNYRPTKTRLLREAEAAGATTIGGGELLIRQVAEAFTLLTEKQAPVDALRTVYDEWLQEEAV